MRFLILVGLLCQSISALAAQPNFLFILVDDLRPALGAYDDAQARTPNIDALAKQAVVFNRAYANVPVCGASRASLLSGIRPTGTRFITYNSQLEEDVPEAISLPKFLKDEGYRVEGNGKIFDVTDDSTSHWSRPVWNPDGQWPSSAKRQTRHEDLQKAYLINPQGIGPSYERLDVADEDYPDGQIARRTIADLQRLSSDEKPFFLAVGFRKPHLPFNAPDKYWRAHDDTNFELPLTYGLKNSVTEAYHNSLELRRQYLGFADGKPLNHARFQRMKRAYYASVSYIDAQVGLLLEALETSPAHNSTHVILLGDHGWNLGEHTMWTKHNLFDIALRVPLIWQLPSREHASSSAPVGLLDIYPTVTELLDSPVSELDGESFAKVMAGKESGEDRHAISRWLDGESVRTAKYRYTEWLDGKNQVVDRLLFDLEADPQETINLAEVEGMQSVTAQLAELLQAEREGFIPQELLDLAKMMRTM